MRFTPFKIIFILPAALLWCCFVTVKYATAQKSQPTYERFQYHHYKWQSFYTKDYKLYFPDGYDSLCKFAADHLPGIIKDSRKETGLFSRAQPNIIIYPSVPQLYESNIGLYDHKQQTFPTVVIKGGRVLMAFTGSYEQFLMQLKEAWLRACWEERFSPPVDVDEQLGERAPACPDWFKEAFIKYSVNGWTLQDEARLHDKMGANKPEDWPELLKGDSVLTGKALCYFLAVQYRGDAILQLIFQFKQGKSLARAVRLVFKRNINTLERECLAFYRQRYADIAAGANTDKVAQILKRHLQADEKLLMIYPNPKQHKTAFVIEKANKRIVYLINENDTLIKRPQKVMHYALPPWYHNYQSNNYPLVAWGKDGAGLFITVPEKGIITIKAYNLSGSFIRENKLYGVDGVNDFVEESKNDRILSAYRKGRSDIVRYHPQKERYTPLTDDRADNVHLKYHPENNTYAYRSGFPAGGTGKDSAGKTYGIYFNSNGEESLKKADTRYEHFEWEQQDNSNIYFQWIAEQRAIERTKDSIARLEQQGEENDINVMGNILEYANKREADDTRQTQQAHGRRVRDSLNASPLFREEKISPYFLQLYRSWYTARVNNDYFINRLQPFRGYLGTFKFPEVGAMIASGFSDLFENYHFNIGYKLPAGTEGSDFFVRFENTKRTTDWHLMYFRKVESLQPDAIGDWQDAQGNPYPTMAKVKTWYFEAGVYFPFNYTWGLEVTPALRKGRTVFLSTNKYSLDFDDLKEWWNINTVTLTGHHLQPVIPLLYKGWKIKISGDAIASYGKGAEFIYGFNTHLEYHLPVVNHITLVTQLKAGYSGGDENILYNFGGTDNNIVPRVDTAVHFAQSSPYAFQQLIGGLRGYEQNSIYGNLYGMLQADVYFPIFYSLIPLRTGFPAIRNLQLGIFTDIACAKETWNTSSPARNSRYAFGFSARTVLAGYPVRFDIAWPGSFNASSVWYLSFSL